METQQNPEGLSRGVSQRLDETVPLLAQITGHMQQTNSQLLGLSADQLSVQRAVQQSVRRQSALILMLCLVGCGAFYLAWQISVVKNALGQSLGELREARAAAELSTKALQALEKQLEQQTAAVRSVVDAAPRLTTDGRGRLRVEITLDEGAARAATKKQAAPVSTTGKVGIAIVNGRIDFDGH